VAFDHLPEPVLGLLWTPLSQADFTEQANYVRVLPGLWQHPPANHFRLLRITGPECFQGLIVLVFDWI
jgi:hypothetical protein